MYTDSQAALKLLKSLRVSLKIVKECHDLLVDIASYFMINLQSVPRHSDFTSKCEADKLARAGTTLKLESEKGEFICHWLPVGI